MLSKQIKLNQTLKNFKSTSSIVDCLKSGGTKYYGKLKWEDGAELKAKYQSLTPAEQNELKTYVANENGNDEAKCVARYDYIVGKYGTTNYENFMNRTIVSHSNSLGNQVISHNAMLFLVVAATLGTFTFAAWFIHKKKQYDL